MSSPLTFPIVCFLRAHLDFWMPDFSRHFAGWFGIFPRVYICIQIVVLRVKLRNCKIVSKNQKDSAKNLIAESFEIGTVYRMGQVGLVFTFIVMGYSMALTFHFYTIGNCRTEIAKIQYHVCLHFFGRERITTGTPLPLRICTFQIANMVMKFYSKCWIIVQAIQNCKLYRWKNSL